MNATQATLGLVMHEFRAPEAATDSVLSFLQLVTDRRDGHLLIPAHQRTPDAWDDSKRARYIARLRESLNGRHPPGSIATYQLVDGQARVSSTFLNDGLQRLTALENLQADPTRFDMDKKGAEDVLRIKISVQHRHYASHQDAMRDFQYINDGTHLTSFELCRGYLTYMENWNTQWEPIIKNVESAVTASEERLISRASNRREVEHKRRRDTLALFYRFVSNDKTHSAYVDIGARDIAKYVESATVIEQRLAGELASLGYAEGAAQAKKFRAFIASETALLEERKAELFGQGKGLSATNHRWLLHLAIWRRNTGVSREQYTQFVNIFLKQTAGGSVWKLQGSKHQVTLGLAHLGHLPTLAEWAGMPKFCERRRRQQAKLLRPGYDNSHVMPFVTNGEGPTFPEPAPTNRSRGARPVEPPTDEEKA